MNRTLATVTAISTRRPLHALLACLPLVGGLGGCESAAPMRPPTPAEMERVEAREMSVVLFRISGTIDGKPATKLGPLIANDAFQVYLANLDRLEAPARVPAASLSESAAAQGWHYWLLPPGIYHLLVLPPGGEQNPPAVAFHAPSGRYGRLTRYKFESGRGAFWSPELAAYVFAGAAPPDFEAIHGFWFEVPRDGQVVYLGSLSAACKSGRGLFGDLIDSCTDYELTQDLQAAQQAAGASLPGLSVQARVVVAYGGTRAGVHLRELGSTSIVAAAPPGIAAAFGGPELDPWAVIPGVGDAIVVFNLLGATFELAAHAREQQRIKDATAAVQPCLERLAGALVPADYRHGFIQALEQATASRGAPLELTDEHVTPGAGVRHRLMASVPILRLIESGQPQSLALEVAMDIRLQDAADQGAGYYSLLSYGPELPARNPFVPRSPLYTRFVPERARPRPVSEWCGAGGADLLAAEIAAGLKHIAAQVAQDLDRQ